MSKYLFFIKSGFKENLIYRSNSILMVLSSVVTLFISVSVWQALYFNKTNVDGITLSDMMVTVIINSIILAFTQCQIANNIADKVNDGSIATDLIKPYNLKWSMYSSQTGTNLFKFIFSTLPIIVLGIFFLDFKMPSSNISLVLFIMSFLNAIILSYILNYIIGLWAFWVKKASYPNFFLRAANVLFGGSVVPLWFYPKVLYVISSFLPFRFIFFEPVKIYLMKSTINESLVIIAMQLFWIVILTLIEKLISRRVQNVITIYGG